jgi:HK97 family phage prohead protease
LPVFYAVDHLNLVGTPDYKVQRHNLTLQQKFLNGPFEVKASDEHPNGYVEGYASTWTKDLVSDRILKGAYTKTINEQVRNKRVRLLNNHASYGALNESILGMVDTASEDNHGLYVKATFAKTAAAQEVRKLCEEGLVKDFSVGIWLVKHSYNADEDCRDIAECGLKEVSLVMDPANPECKVMACKALNNHPSYFQVAPADTPWDATGAETRYKLWVASHHESLKSFGSLYYDDTDGVQFQFVDIIDNRPMIVPAALRAIHSALPTLHDLPVSKSALTTLVDQHCKAIGLDLTQVADNSEEVSKHIAAIQANLLLTEMALY